MWLIWVIATHLLKYFWAVLLCLIKPSILQQYNQLINLRVNIWWEPKSCTRIISNVVALLFANAFPPKALAKLVKCERYFCGFGQTQRTAGSAAKASFNASITLASSDSMAVLTIGIVINVSPIFYVGRNVLKFCSNLEGGAVTL